MHGPHGDRAVLPPRVGQQNGPVLESGGEQVAVAVALGGGQRQGQALGGIIPTAKHVGVGADERQRRHGL